MPTYGFTGSVTDRDYARMLALAGARVAVEGSSHWAPTATAADRTVSLAAGNGYLPGIRHETTAPTVVSCAINSSGSIRWDMIVARADWTAKTVSFVVLQGTPGAGGPIAATRSLLTTGNVYDFPIVVCRVISGGGAFAPTDLYDLRLWGGVGGPYQIPQETFYTYHELAPGSELRVVTSGLRYRRTTAGGWESVLDALAGIRGWAMKAGDESVAASTAMQNDDHLTVAVQANSVYSLQLRGIYNAPVAGGMRLQFALPAGAALSNGMFLCGGTGSATQHGANSSATGLLTGISGIAADAALDVRHRLVTSATPGNVTLQWAQDAASGTTTLRSGSDLLLERVA